MEGLNVLESLSNSEKYSKICILLQRVKICVEQVHIDWIGQKHSLISDNAEAIQAVLLKSEVLQRDLVPAASKVACSIWKALMQACIILYDPKDHRLFPIAKIFLSTCHYVRDQCD